MVFLVESESESESEESSEDENDDASSGDSAEIGPIFIDESVCPPGCDRRLYDLTFTLRSRRHELEKELLEENEAIDKCRAMITSCNNKIKVVQAEMDIKNDELTVFMVF